MLVMSPPTRVKASIWRNVELVIYVSTGAIILGYVLYALHVNRDIQQGRREKFYPAAGGTRKDQLYLESVAMAEYALKSGNLKSETPRGADLAFLDQVQHQHDAKVAWKDWDALPLPTRDLLIKRLAVVHDNLTRLVAPASPQTLALLSYEGSKRRAFPWLGNIRLVRMMVGLAILLTPAFIGLAISVGTRLEADGLFSGRIGEKYRQRSIWLSLLPSGLRPRLCPRHSITSET
jgi:hypothetical protein